MKKGFLLMMFLFPVYCFAQKKDSLPDLIFKVRNPKMHISISPDDSILWIDYNNIIKITINGANKISSVELSAGNITKVGDVYVARVNEGRMAVLNVFERTEDGKPRINFTKMYYLKAIPKPVIYICGIKEDSTADKIDFQKKNNIVAVSSFYKRKLPVISFRMLYVKDGVVDTLYSKNSLITVDMRNEIQKLQPGSVIYFENIICSLPDGRKQEISPAAIYLNETNNYKVGYRKIAY